MEIDNDESQIVTFLEIVRLIKRENIDIVEYDIDYKKYKDCNKPYLTYVLILKGNILKEGYSLIELLDELKYTNDIISEYGSVFLAQVSRYRSDSFKLHGKIYFNN